MFIRVKCLTLLTNPNPIIWCIPFEMFHLENKLVFAGTAWGTHQKLKVVMSPTVFISPLIQLMLPCAVNWDHPQQAFKIIKLIPARTNILHLPLSWNHSTRESLMGLPFNWCGNNRRSNIQHIGLCTPYIMGFQCCRLKITKHLHE